MWAGGLSSRRVRQACRFSALNPQGADSLGATVNYRGPANQPRMALYKHSGRPDHDSNGRFVIMRRSAWGASKTWVFLRALFSLLCRVCCVFRYIYMYIYTYTPTFTVTFTFSFYLFFLPFYLFYLFYPFPLYTSYTSVHLCTPLYTSVHLFAPLCTSLHLCAPLCTSVHLCFPHFFFV